MTSPSPASATAPPEDGLSAVLAAARTLWPPPLEVAYARGRGRTGSVCEQILLPSPAAPRICVPADTRRGAARAVMRFSSALPPRQIATRLLSAAALAVGPRSLVPHRVVVSGTAADGLRDHLSATVGRPVSFGFGIGTARANRKPVLALFAGDGSRLGFAKIGIDPFTDEQVRREARALTEVEQARIEGVRTPGLVSSSTWNDHPVLVIGALTPSPWETARRGARIPRTQMTAFGRAFGVQETPLTQSPWWAAVVETVSGLPPGGPGSALLEAMDVITTRWTDQPVPLGAWHGDWTPWNMGWSDGQLLLWDFERFETGAPVGLDACHFAVSVPSPTSDPEEIVRRLDAATPCDDRALAELVKALYLVAITSRYQVAARSENGRLIAPRAELMGRCLGDWLMRTAHGGVPA